MLNQFLDSPAGIFSLSIAVCVVIVVETIYLYFATKSDTKSRINRRMRISNDKKVSQKDILIQLRKERGMTAEGGLTLPIVWLNRLIVQAGLSVGLRKFALYWFLYVLFVSAIFFAVVRIPIAVVASLPITAVMMPLLWLNSRKNAKIRLFGKQLPEAIELITRSLKAGHPVPVALTMVAREMPDPIGTEFGMVVDEVTYGSDLVSALLMLYDRVGHPDLPLLVSSVSIQASTGGNLREILDSLAHVIRNRLKMKAKIRAISSEGRMSAMFLSALPIVLFGVLFMIVPGYYRGIWEEPLTYYLFGGLIFWLVMGNLLIMKMVSFKF